MKAWRFHGIGDMRLDEVPYPELKPDWVILKPRVVQPSVSEAQRAVGLAISGTETFKKLLAEKAPIALFGHEFCAKVVEVGADVTNVRVGERVAVESRVPCHQCRLCLGGSPWLCRKGPSMGRHIAGGFAEYTTVPAEILEVLPESVTDNEGACIQPLTGAVKSIAAARIQLGDTVAVIGQGPMGLYCLQLARVSGAGKIIGVDVRQESLALSRQLGADYTVNAREVDPVKAVLEYTEGIGADVVFEAAGGSPQQGLAGTTTLPQAMAMVRDLGKVVQVAWIGNSVTCPIDSWRERGITYLTSESCPPKLTKWAVHLVATKRVQLAPLISHVLEGLDKVPEAFHITSHKSEYKATNPAQVVVSKWDSSG
ncbi:MAG: alcohol dehydrogenase catalytic domain-containing protein [Chloroflexi bacterium]|nr:alcohol dehydrogenase catalytic domain-containing protein [Chloroflexota bacterium]